MAILLLAGCSQKREDAEIGLDTIGKVDTDPHLEEDVSLVKRAHPSPKAMEMEIGSLSNNTEKLALAQRNLDLGRYEIALNMLEELYQEAPSARILAAIKRCKKELILGGSEYTVFEHELKPSFPQEWNYGSNLSFGWKCGLLFADDVEVQFYYGENKETILKRRYSGDKESDAVSSDLLQLPEGTEFIRWRMEVVFEDGYRTRKEGRIKVLWKL